jgi:PIN domain nuclease of toxin-antitoxin system
VKILLDTHVFLWWLDNPRRLSEGARRAIRDERNAVFVSAAVVWEIVIKKSLGKLSSPDNIDEVIAENRFAPLAITVEHALAVEALPGHHRDPFDRILIAQARAEGMTLANRDLDIRKYPVNQILA